MPSILRKRSTRIVFTATTGLLVATLGFFAWQSFYPVQAAAGWKVGVLHSDVTRPRHCCRKPMAACWSAASWTTAAAASSRSPPTAPGW